MFLLGTATITGSFDRLGAIPTFLHSRSKLVRRLLEASESSSVTTTRTAPSLLRIACNSFGNRCRTDCSPDPPDPSVGRGNVSMSWFLKRRLRNPRTNVFVRRSSQSRMISRSFLPAASDGLRDRQPPALGLWFITYPYWPITVPRKPPSLGTRHVVNGYRMVGDYDDLLH